MRTSVVTLALLGSAAAYLPPPARFAAAAKKTAPAAPLADLLRHTAATAAAMLLAASPALALPSGAPSPVIKDPDALLRWALPISQPSGKPVRQMQQAIEAIPGDIRSGRISAARSDIKDAKQLGTKERAKVLAPVKAGSEARASTLLDEIVSGLEPIDLALTFPDGQGGGSPQERAGLDAAYAGQEKVQLVLTELEELMVPDDFVSKIKDIPSEFKGRPVLNGRAKVGIVTKKADGTKYDIKGVLFDKAELTIVIDGYNAPLTAGNFVDLVQKGFYDKLPIDRADGFVVQAGDPDGPDGPKVGYVEGGEVRKLPLEIVVRGDTSPLYSSTTEEDARGNKAVVLPFAADGTLAMAREEYDNDSASSQFFLLLFESDLTPAGRNMMDGRYSVFGYTVDGSQFLRGIGEGDVIQSIKVLEGKENLGKLE